MRRPLKWLFMSCTIILVVLGVAYVVNTQNKTTQTTDDVNLLTDTVEKGSIRGELNEIGEIDIDADLVLSFVNLEEVIAYLTTQLALAQKDYPYDIQLKYVFFDENDNITEDEKKVKGIHFQANYVDEEGVVKGTDERRLSLKQLTN